MYGLGTGKQGFFTYSAGAAIAKVASDNGLQLRIQPYGGTSAYVPAVNAKEVDFGLANELETNYAVTGTVIYKDKPQPDVRVVAILTPLYSALFVRKDFRHQDHRRPQGQAGADRLRQPEGARHPGAGHAGEWRSDLRRHQEGAGAERRRRRQ